MLRVPTRLTRISLLACCLLAVCAPVLRGQCADGTPAPTCEAGAKRAPARSVAVLSFENRSRDTSDAFLAEGLADEVATRLAQIERLVVASRSQVRRLRSAATMPIPELGQALNVAYLVSGSVQRAGSRIRINVEVLRAKDARQLFGDVYDRDRTQLLDVQAEIASSIAVIIAGRLLASERQVLAGRPTRNADAYEHFLRGNLTYAKRTATTEAMAATREYARAVSLDPVFARAWAGLARAEAWLHAYGSDPFVPHDSLALVALTHAKRLAPTEAATLLAAGEVAFLSRQNNRLADARQHVRAALGRDSTNTELLLLAGDIEMGFGDMASAIAFAERAAMIDPRDPAPSTNLVVRYAFQRRFDVAARYADRLIAQAPDDPDSYFLRAMLAVMRDGDMKAMHADVARARRVLGAKTLNDAPNWVIYPLLRLDSSLMAAIDDPTSRLTPELLWMKMQRARAAGLVDVALMHADSLARLETSVHRRRGPGANGLWLADALVVLGRADEAAALAENANSERLAFFAYEWARILAAIGRPEQALDMLEQLIRTPSYTTSAILRLDPGFSPLRANPRFRQLIEARP